MAGDQKGKMAAVVKRQAAETLTAVELNRGEVLEFTLRSGQVRRLVVEETAASVLEKVEPGGIIYHFTARVVINGRPMTMERYVCSQECFYEPYVVNGMRIWLDAVSDITAMIPMRKQEEERAPHKHMRLAVQEATLPICPQEMSPWYLNDKNFIDVGDCYNGDDCWLGPYLGQACHGGLDINHRKGEPLWAPIDFDDHWLFNSLKAGDNNNRWRGIRKWPNGDTWALQSHHLVDMVVPEHGPLKRGTQYATAAGVYVGSHQHSHFVFRITPREGTPEIHIDPWILFWQIFCTAKTKAGQVQAVMSPLVPAKVGEPVAVSAAASQGGNGGGELSCFWTFGDGGFAMGKEARHTFASPGVYPITLVVDDGRSRATCTQHVTVDGAPMRTPALTLAAPDDLSFRPRPVAMMDTFGLPAGRCLPHTLRFTARPNRPRPAAQTLELRNLGGGTLPSAATKVDYAADPGGWLAVEPVQGNAAPPWHGRPAHVSQGRPGPASEPFHGRDARGTHGQDARATPVAALASGPDALSEGGKDGNAQALRISADGSGLPAGPHAATVAVDCPGAANSPQTFRVELHIPAGPPKAGSITVDDRDEGFECTPYFWVGHRFCRAKQRGCGGFYLTNGGRALEGEYARFTPDLPAGRHEVSFHEATPFPKDSSFLVRIRHARGEETIRAAPAASRAIGTFDFADGTDGFVELLAGGSKGLVVADAVVFTRVR